VCEVISAVLKNLPIYGPSHTVGHISSALT